MKHSDRARANMTKQLRAQLQFLKRDLRSEQIALQKAKTFLKYPLPGVKSMVRRHELGVKKTKQDIINLKKRIRMRQRKGQINKIL